MFLGGSEMTNKIAERIKSKLSMFRVFENSTKMGIQADIES